MLPKSGLHLWAFGWLILGPDFSGGRIIHWSRGKIMAFRNELGLSLSGLLLLSVLTWSFHTCHEDR